MAAAVNTEITTRRAALRAGAAAVGSLLAGGRVLAGDPPKGGPGMKAFELAELLAERKRSGGPYHRFLDESTMSMGIYHLPKGTADRQSPHDEDEAYYVLEGKAKFETDGGVVEVKPGTTLFVEAFAPHRFIEIEKDLTLMVFFSKAPVQKSK